MQLPILVAIACQIFFLAFSSYAADFFCPSGDVPCLIAAIKEANGLPGEHTITLEAGTYTLRTADEPPNGLPSITGNIWIQGSLPETIVERDPAAARFRIFHVAAGAQVGLDSLTIRNGVVGPPIAPSGGGLLNQGQVEVRDTVFTRNVAINGGAIANFGSILLLRTILDNNSVNFEGGGIDNRGNAYIDTSTISRNDGDPGGGIFNGSEAHLVLDSSAIIFNTTALHAAGLYNRGTLEIYNSTVAQNDTRLGTIENNDGLMTIVNSTISFNRSRMSNAAGGIYSTGGTMEVVNTILALNVNPAGQGADCRGPIRSLGNNIIGDTTFCVVDLQGTDLTGDPGLDSFVDEGLPGRAYFPLLAESRAVNSANPEFCPETDQLGNPRPRPGVCSIGSIEFQGTGPVAATP